MGKLYCIVYMYVLFLFLLFLCYAMLCYAMLGYGIVWCVFWAGFLGWFFFLLMRLGMGWGWVFFVWNAGWLCYSLSGLFFEWVCWLFLFRLDFGFEAVVVLGFLFLRDCFC
jgi:hypothetical protein